MDVGACQLSLLRLMALMMEVRRFFGTSAIPQVGSDKADLIAVLPNVTLEFCNTINLQLGLMPVLMPG